MMTMMKGLQQLAFPYLTSSRRLRHAFAAAVVCCCCRRERRHRFCICVYILVVVAVVAAAEPEPGDGGTSWVDGREKPMLEDDASMTTAKTNLQTLPLMRLVFPQ
jgi:hypothetical protein